jgi:hypothetical protein
MPPAGVIRRTSYSPCASLLVARGVARARPPAEEVAGHPAPPGLRPPGARGVLERHPRLRLGVEAFSPSATVSAPVASLSKVNDRCAEVFYHSFEEG